VLQVYKDKIKFVKICALGELLCSSWNSVLACCVDVWNLWLSHDNSTCS